MKKEFIEGKWYRGNEGCNYIKFSHLEDCGGYNKIYYTEMHDHGEYSVIDDNWANTSMEKYALDHPATIEELIKILPPGHPDLNQTPQYEIY